VLSREALRTRSAIEAISWDAATPTDIAALPAWIAIEVAVSAAQPACIATEEAQSAAAKDEWIPEARAAAVACAVLRM
jgi:hypothetical protein